MSARAIASRSARKRDEGEAAAPDAALKPKPVNPVTEGEAAADRHRRANPPPNARTAPTEEEEAELSNAFMEGASVADQVLDTEAAAAPKELEVGLQAQGQGGQA